MIDNMDTVDIYRPIALFFCQVAFAIINTSPNSDNEMGREKGDYIVPGGEVTGLAYKRVVFTLLVTYLIINNLHHYSTQSLSTCELLLFGIMIMGCLLRVWAYWTLGRYFTFTLGLRKDHALVKSGPYKYLIHPSYTGQIIALLAGMLFLRLHWIVYLCFIGGIFIEAHERIAKEEDMLAAKFHDEWTEYQKARWRIIPLVY